MRSGGAILLGLACLTMPLAGLASLPARPGPDDGSNFHVFAGVEDVTYHLDPRGATAFTDAGLDPRGVDTMAMLGVGWVFHRPLRLDLVVGGGEVAVDREGVTPVLGRALAELHLVIVESRRLSLEASFSLGSHVLVYDGLPDEESIIGAEAGLGLTARAALLGPFGLTASYRQTRVRFERTSFEFGDDEPAILLHPTGRHHGLRVLLTWDL
ncbi:hypothetical protein GF314_05105 [bacterium]|nr:hypothetical protein [bacterium]